MSIRDELFKYMQVEHTPQPAPPTAAPKIGRTMVSSSSYRPMIEGVEQEIHRVTVDMLTTKTFLESRGAETGIKDLYEWSHIYRRLRSGKLREDMRRDIQELRESADGVFRMFESLQVVNDIAKLLASGAVVKDAEQSKTREGSALANLITGKLTPKIAIAFDTMFPVVEQWIQELLAPKWSNVMAALYESWLESGGEPPFKFVFQGNKLALTGDKVSPKGAGTIALSTKSLTHAMATLLSTLGRTTKSKDGEDDSTTPMQNRLRKQKQQGQQELIDTLKSVLPTFLNSDNNRQVLNLFHDRVPGSANILQSEDDVKELRGDVVSAMLAGKGTVKDISVDEDTITLFLKWIGDNSKRAAQVLGQNVPRILKIYSELDMLNTNKSRISTYSEGLEYLMKMYVRIVGYMRQTKTDKYDELKPPAIFVKILDAYRNGELTAEVVQAVATMQQFPEIRTALEEYLKKVGREGMLTVRTPGLAPQQKKQATQAS